MPQVASGVLGAMTWHCQSSLSRQPGPVHSVEIGTWLFVTLASHTELSCIVEPRSYLPNELFERPGSVWCGQVHGCDTGRIEMRMTCLLELRVESIVTPSSLIFSDNGIGEPVIFTWCMLLSDSFRAWVPRRMASDFSGFRSRQL